mmetsp:Transcript_45995/g.112005  ORF Transcript_45995/g.112005 Transcript_45995/m.112005 type:complete len:284 (-) Transcript_45995:6-857(-)
MSLAALARVLDVQMSSQRRSSSRSISRTPSWGTARTTVSAALAMSSGASPSSIPSLSALRIVGMREERASPAPCARAASARALEAVMGGVESWGMRKGSTMLPRTARSCRSPARELAFSSSRLVSSAGTTSSMALCPSCLKRASKALADEARTSCSSSHSALRTVLTRWSRCEKICCLVQLRMTSARPRHTPARTCVSGEERLLWRIGITSGRARSPILLTSSPMARPATVCFSRFPLARQSTRVRMSVGRIVRRVLSWLWTTLFHTWKLAWHTLGLWSDLNM